MFGSCDGDVFFSSNFHQPYRVNHFTLSVLPNLTWLQFIQFCAYMASSSVQQEAGSFGRQSHSKTTANSTQSGQGSEPLFDTFVVVRVEEGLRKVRGLQVKAPEGLMHLNVWWSTHMISARAISAKASTSRLTLIKAPPGVRPSDTNMRFYHLKKSRVTRHWSC